METTKPVTTSGWYELTDGRVQQFRWVNGRLVNGAIVGSWAELADTLHETGVKFTAYAIDEWTGRAWAYRGQFELRESAARQVDMILDRGGDARVREIELPQVAGCTDGEAHKYWSRIAAAQLRETQS